MTTMTSAERRAVAQARYNGELASCPGHHVLGILSEKWVTLVLEALNGGPLRRSELSSIVAGASQKMLTQTLRRLERDGLVVRSITASVPVRVDYELTPLGADLAHLQQAILDWGRQHIGAISAARARFDSGQVARR